MNPVHAPIFCLDTLHILNGPGITGSLLQEPLFQVKVVTREGEYLVATSLSVLMDACRRHNPVEYRYVEQLKWYVANGGIPDFRLFLAMEDEG